MLYFRRLLPGVFLLLPPAGSQNIDRLEIRNNPRKYEYRIEVEDLESAYVTAGDGSLRMLPNPPSKPVVRDSAAIAISRASGGGALLSVLRGGVSSAMPISAANRALGENIITGLPFGLGFLPPGGAATVNQRWVQEATAAPVDGSSLRAEVQYTMTLAGRRTQSGCGECVEILILGVRRFTPGRALQLSLRAVPNAAEDRWYTSWQPFGAGSLLLDRKEGFIHRFEWSANPSQFTVLPVPGLMRRVAMERSDGR
jgi:hypothetical protein